MDQTIPSFTIDEILEDKASFGKDWEEDREAKRAKLLSECYAHREPVEMASKCVSGVCSADTRNHPRGKQKCRPNANNGLEKDMTWIVNTKKGRSWPQKRVSGAGATATLAVQSRKRKQGEE